MPMEPVSPGEPILPRMTAEWYNSTLPRNKGNKGVGHLEQSIDVQAFLATGSVTRFSAVGIEDVLSEGNYANLGVKVNASPVEGKWGVVQTALNSTKKTGPVILSGPTYAAVTAGTGDFVDIVSGVLTQVESGIARLLHFATPYSLISLGGGGSGGTATWYQFTLTSALTSGTATADIYDIDDGTTLIESGVTIKSSMTAYKVLGAGDKGWCQKQGSNYYVGNGNCPEEVTS